MGFLWSFAHLLWLRGKLETIFYYVAQFITVGACWWKPWIRHHYLNNFTILTLEFDHRGQRLC